METCFGITPYQYVLNNRGVVFGFGNFEVRLVREAEVNHRRVNGAILSEDEAGIVYFPRDATIGKPYKPTNRDGRSNQMQLAQWFRDACLRQRRNHIPQVKAGTPFCIFSSTFRGSDALRETVAFVEAKSLRIHGNQIVLKIDVFDPFGSMRPGNARIPLVEVPICAALPAGRYSVRVDWGVYDKDENEYPKGSHNIFFDVVK
jgi:hypothetical protein